MSPIHHLPTRAKVVVIGVSTGGPSALDVLLRGLPADFGAPLLVVQHMPRQFTGSLAERLDRCCALRVRQAEDGEELRPGTVWLAPGDAHMEVAAPSRRSRAATVRLHRGEPLNHCRPSVDYLFASAARVFGRATLAVVMTGMGSDGLSGARLVHQAGGTVLTQDEASSAVWGMPGRVFEAGISCAPVALGSLALELTERVEPLAGPCAPQQQTGTRQEAT